MLKIWSPPPTLRLKRLESSRTISRTHQELAANSKFFFLLNQDVARCRKCGENNWLFSVDTAFDWDLVSSHGHGCSFLWRHVHVHPRPTASGLWRRKQSRWRCHNWALFKTPVGWWWVRGLHYPLPIILGIIVYNHLYSPTRIQWNKKGASNTAHLWAIFWVYLWWALRGNWGSLAAGEEEFGGEWWGTGESYETKWWFP